MRLSIVIPAYNEEKNIKSTVQDVIRFCECHPKIDAYEIIVVDDGSKDQTFNILNQLQHRHSRMHVISHDTNRGYGAALKSGFAQTQYEWIFYMDSDKQFSIEDIHLFLKHADANKKVMFTGYRSNRKDGVLRSLNAWIYRLSLNIGFGIRVKDVNCAFKLFPREIVLHTLYSNGATINCELFYYAKKHKLKVIEIPVNHYSRQYGHQTGAHVRVVIGAMIRLADIRLKFWGQEIASVITKTRSLFHL
ncbi:MAG: hypothetical protein RL094_801 [Candidatus Parcubacteria bacterium]|jgi:glycosyltransferase involved in cell wall biosynthesis